jgi:hypothetical protein
MTTLKPTSAASNAAFEPDLAEEAVPVSLGVSPNAALSRSPGWGPVLGAALAMFGLAWWLMPPALGIGDSAEFTLALALAGIPHPTGYPLYVLVGHLFVRAAHALGASWVAAAALWSAAGAAVAAGACVRIGQHLLAALEDQDRLLGRAPLSPVVRRIALAFPVAALAFNPVWLDASTVAEVHTWHLACLAMAAASMVGWLRVMGVAAALGGAAEPGPGPGAREHRMAAFWGLLCGLCGTQHATALLFVAPMSAALVAALVSAGRWRRSLALVAVGVGLVPLASYGWIAWRAVHPAGYQWPVGAGLGEWWMHVRGAAYTYYLGGFAPKAEEWAMIRTAILPWVLPGFALGSLVALRTRPVALRWGLLALLGAAAVQVAFIVSYSVPDPAPYFIPVLLTALLPATPALAWLGRRSSPRLLVVCALALVVALAAWSVPRAFIQHWRLSRVDAKIRAAWRYMPIERGIVFWPDDHFHRFVLLQRLEGQKPEIYVDNPDMLIWPARRRAFRERFGFDPLAGLPLRVTADLEQIPGHVRSRTSVPMIVLPKLPKE